MSQSRFRSWFQHGLSANPDDATLLDVCVGLFRRLFWFLLTGGCIAALIACYVSWNARQAQFLTLWNGLREACFELVDSEKQSIVRELPLDQAEFWLAETERVLQQTSRTSEQLMGAALILDAPLQDLRNDQAWQLRRDERTEGIGERPQQIVLPFQHSGSAKCLDLAAEAVGMSPDNKELWRLRAMLLFYHGWDETSVLGPDWQTVLTAAAAHDPDNALYDYLTAFILKSQSVEVQSAEWPAFGDSVHVKQPELYQAALTHFEYGQAKAYLRFPVDDGRLALQFANQSSLSPHDAARVAMSASGQTYGDRGTALIMKIQRWIGVRLDDAYRDGDLELAIQLALQANHFCDQSESEFAGELIQGVAQTYRDIHAVNIHRIRQDCPELLASVTYPDIATRAAEGELRSKIQIKIFTGVYERLGITNPYQFQSADEVTAVCKLLLWGAGSLCLSLIAFAACYRIKPTSGVVTFGEFRHAFTFGTAFAVSWVLAGGITKDVISESNLEIVIRVIVGTLFGVVCIFLLRRWYRRGKSQRVVRKRFLIPGIVVSACFLQAVLFPLIQYSISADRAPFGSINAIPAAMVWLKPNFPLPAWQQCVVNWWYNSGPAISIVGGLACSVLWLSWRVWDNRHAAKNGTRRQLIASTLHCVGQPLLALGLLLSTWGLAALPACLATAEAWHNYRVACCMPDLMHRHRTEVKQALLSDKLLMRQLTEAAAAYGQFAAEEYEFTEQYRISYDPDAHSGGMDDGF